MYPFKFRPILKTVLWGGEKIIPYKQIESDQKQVGESWELSGVKGNESVVANGELAGTTLPELLAREKERLLGRCTPTTSWPGSATTRRARPRCGMSWMPTRGRTSARASPSR